MVAGESANPTKKHLLQLANYFKVKNAAAIIDEVQSITTNWKMYADLCGVSRNTKNSIQKILNP